MKEANIIPLIPKKKFRVLFDVRHFNGSVEIEATNEAEARLKFDQMATEALIERTDDIAVDVEQIEKVA